MLCWYRNISRNTEKVFVSLRRFWSSLGNCCCEGSLWNSEESPYRLAGVGWTRKTPTLLPCSSLYTLVVQTSSSQCGQVWSEMALTAGRRSRDTSVKPSRYRWVLFPALPRGKPETPMMVLSPDICFPSTCTIFFIPSDIKLSEADKYQQVACWNEWTGCTSLKLMGQLVLDAHASPLLPCFSLPPLLLNSNEKCSLIGLLWYTSKTIYS